MENIEQPMTEQEQKLLKEGFAEFEPGEYSYDNLRPRREAELALKMARRYKWVLDNCKIRHLVGNSIETMYYVEYNPFSGKQPPQGLDAYIDEQIEKERE